MRRILLIGPIERSLQSMAEITIYSTQWCGDCRRAKQFLRERGIAFKEVNIDEAPEAEDLVLRVNNGRRKSSHDRSGGPLFCLQPFRSLPAFRRAEDHPADTIRGCTSAGLRIAAYFLRRRVLDCARESFTSRRQSRQRSRRSARCYEVGIGARGDHALLPGQAEPPRGQQVAMRTASSKGAPRRPDS